MSIDPGLLEPGSLGYMLIFMAQVGFLIKYYFNSNGLNWDEIPEEDLKTIVENCRKGIYLNIKTPIYPEEPEIQNVDNYSDIPAKAKALGFDSFAEVYLTFDVENFILEDLGVEILDESASYVGDVDSVFGTGVFQVLENILIDQPEQIWVD